MPRQAVARWLCLSVGRRCTLARGQHGQRSSGAGFAYLAEAAARWLRPPEVPRPPVQETSPGAGLAYRGRNAVARCSYVRAGRRAWRSDQQRRVFEPWSRAGRAYRGGGRALATSIGVRWSCLFMSCCRPLARPVPGLVAGLVTRSRRFAVVVPRAGRAYTGPSRRARSLHAASTPGADQRPCAPCRGPRASGLRSSSVPSRAGYAYIA